MKFRVLIIDLIIKLVEIIALLAGFHGRILLAKIFTFLTKPLLSKRWKISYDNMSRAIGTGKDEKWLKQKVLKCFQGLLLTYLEALVQKRFRKKYIEKHIVFENIQLINELYSRGKGVILLSAHYGNWELLAYSAGMLSGIPMLIIVKSQKYGNKTINKSRTAGGNEVVKTYNAIRTLVKRLRDGNAVAMLADQSELKGRGVDVEFFGKSVPSFSSPAELALKFNVPVILGFAERGEDYIYRVKLEELKHDDLTFSEENIKIFTRRYFSKLEEAIERKPEMWAWQHKRWKHAKN